MTQQHVNGGEPHQKGRGTKALLIIDVQRGIAERGGSPELFERITHAADSARAAEVPVIYVKVGFRDGYPELSPRSPMRSRIAGSSGFIEGRSSEIHPAVAPEPGDVIVTKRRVSAFVGSDLDVVLRAGGINSLVLAGISTSGAILSTVRAAADLDFELTVLSDGCAEGGDGEVHRVLIEKVFPRQATVQTVEQWVSSLGARTEPEPARSTQ